MSSSKYSYHFDSTHFVYKKFADNLKFVSQLNNTVNFLNSEKRYQFIKCAVPSFHQDELLVACGETSGKVSIINFQPSSDNYLEFSKFLSSCDDRSPINISFSTKTKSTMPGARVERPRAGIALDGL